MASRFNRLYYYIRRALNQNAEPNPSKKQKADEPEGAAVGILQLPQEVLRKVFVQVVLHDGDPAIGTLALTCQAFRRVVEEGSFLEQAHFAWLDGEVNWQRYSEAYKQAFRVPYLVSDCKQCGRRYKDMTGYKGRGRRGELFGVESEKDMDGYCSLDCFYEAGCSFYSE